LRSDSGVWEKPICGFQTVAIPAFAGFIMLAWDWSMEPDWSRVDQAWIWRDGGMYFVVPISNFFGWYLTALVFFQVFALYCRIGVSLQQHSDSSLANANTDVRDLCHWEHPHPEAADGTVRCHRPTGASLVDDANTAHRCAGITGRHAPSMYCRLDTHAQIRKTSEVLRVGRIPVKPHYRSAATTTFRMVGYQACKDSPGGFA
jgi:hypothetical protein